MIYLTYKRYIYNVKKYQIQVFFFNLDCLLSEYHNKMRNKYNMSFLSFIFVRFALQKKQKTVLRIKKFESIAAAIHQLWP